ncbi:MAG: hypothetical protein HS101_17050 [Planctomycetia bacterium]|nr:hypothetical protein [Planctomycetia bacterium]
MAITELTAQEKNLLKLYRELSDPQREVIVKAMMEQPPRDAADAYLLGLVRELGPEYACKLIRAAEWELDIKRRDARAEARAARFAVC